MLSEGVLRIPLRPFYISGPNGQMFCLFSDVPEDDVKEAWVCLMPFAEEMNRCRAMISMQARKLASLNIATLIPDYYGTGDSEGEFSQASWDIWKSDIYAAISWLQKKGFNRIRLWGVRMGALLAAEIADENKAEIDKLVFWQPVVDGKMMLTQFLRIRVAAAMDRGEPKESTKVMRERFASGETVEISGYNLPASLAQAIDSKHLGKFSSLGNMQVDWYEQYNQATGSISLPSRNIINQWKEQKNAIEEHLFTGPPFWQVHQREISTDLIEKTTELARQMVLL